MYIVISKVYFRKHRCPTITLMLPFQRSHSLSSLALLTRSISKKRKSLVERGRDRGRGKSRKRPQWETGESIEWLFAHCIAVQNPKQLEDRRGERRRGKRVIRKMKDGIVKENGNTVQFGFGERQEGRLLTGLSCCSSLMRKSGTGIGDLRSLCACVSSCFFRVEILFHCVFVNALSFITSSLCVCTYEKQTSPT